MGKATEGINRREKTREQVSLLFCQCLWQIPLEYLYRSEQSYIVTQRTTNDHYKDTSGFARYLRNDLTFMT